MIVRKLRLAKGWSQETLAEISDLSVRTVQRIERGGNASLESLSALASVFEIELSELTTETDMPQQIVLPDNERQAMEYVRGHQGVLYPFDLLSGDDSPPGGRKSIRISGWHLVFVAGVWLVFGWGMGVAAHGLGVFEIFSPFTADWEKRQIEKRLRKLND